jgi:hypothetical protein
MSVPSDSQSVPPTLPYPEPADGSQRPSVGRRVMAWCNTARSHLGALIYLQGQLRLRRWQRESVLGRVILAVFFVVFVAGVLATGAAAALLGYLMYRNITDITIWGFVWNGLLFVFVVAWFINLTSEIQRNDSISLDRLMHLPISPSHAFALNFFASWINFPLLYFSAAVLGLSLGGAVAIGPQMLLGGLLLAIYLMMITAVTSQLQGILTAWMANPRRRRLMMLLIQLLVGGFFVTLSISMNRFLFKSRDQVDRATPARVEPPLPEAVQPALPAEVETAIPLAVESDESETKVHSADVASTLATPESPSLASDVELQGVPPEGQSSVPLESIDASVSNQVTTAPTAEPADAADAADARRVRAEARANARSMIQQRLYERLQWIDRWVPPMWLAACMGSLTHFHWDVLWMVPLMIGVTVVSLRANYRMTLKHYRHGYDGEAARSVDAAMIHPSTTGSATNVSSTGEAQAVGSGKDGSIGTTEAQPWMERSFYRLSDTTSAIVALSWMTLWRAPEMKLQLLIPLLPPALFLFMSSYWRTVEDPYLQTLAMAGVAGFGLFTSSGMLGNMFGMDRDGFRAWVLSPIPRVQILEGRNLAFGIPAWGLAMGIVCAIGLWWRVPFDKILYALLAISTFVPLYLLIANCMSILSPFALPQGSVSPKHFSWKTVVINCLLSTTFPMLLAGCLIPLGVEWGVRSLWTWLPPIPIALLLGIPWLVGSIAVYRGVLPRVGKLLAYRELEILKTVVSKEE